ncbi:MAG: aldose 1-epimerase [Thermomicrobiales bacterium]
MTFGGARCTVTEVTLPRGIRAVLLESDLVAVTVLPDKGADIYELIFKPRQLDVLWKSPWGLRRHAGGIPVAANSHTAWSDAYEGGWQEIFPSGGGPCVYKGVELSFHGEASTLAWDVEVGQDAGDAAEARFSVRLARSPFRIERVMRVEAGKPTLHLRERITNDGGEPVDYMWGHHPAYGAPFLSGACRIDTNAQTIRADDEYDPETNPMNLDGRSPWPHAERQGVTTDLSRVPDLNEPRAMLGYLGDFDGDTAWYGMTNTEFGVGVGLAWPVVAFPFAWFWQEMHATPGFPWYKGVYVMAIEPATSIPGQGLTTVIEKTGYHRTLDPGESADAELVAVFYESSTGISRIAADGTVTTT